MGLLELIFGKRDIIAEPPTKFEEGMRDSEIEAGKLDLDTEYLANKLAEGMDEEFSIGKVGRYKGYISKSGIVGVFPVGVSIVDKSKLSEVRLDELEQDGNLIGVKGGTLVDSDLLNRIIGLLRNESIEYTLLINKTAEMPLVIATKRGNIDIAPVILP